jgi:rRNA maturation RNase YbeY
MKDMSRIKQHRIFLAVQYASSSRHLPNRAQLRRWFSAALKRDARITLRIVDEPEGRKLNKDYRGKDYATNVLTFVYDDAEPTPDVTTDETTGHPTDGTPSHSTRSPTDGNQVAGYKQPEDVCQVVGYSHSTRQSAEELLAGHPKDDSHVAGYHTRPLSWDESIVSGDVVICAPVVEREAAAQHKDLLAHYAHLAIHAALHLQGYEHGDEKDAAAMESLETALMLKLHYPDPYQATRH